MATAPVHNSNTSTALNLRRLFVLRSIGIVGQVLVIGTAVTWLKLPLPLLPLSAILVTLTACNLLIWWRARHPRSISDWEFFVQLVVDVLALAGVLYFAGGASNPFAWFFLLPLIIAATVLSKVYIWTLAGLTVACYSVLMKYYVPLDLVEMLRGSGFKQHVFGMWSGFMLNAGMIAYFVAGMASTLRERERFLAEASEQALRDEHLVALGTLAAGAAHELGTPLGTMAIVAGELEREYPADKDPVLHQKLGILRDQIARCKQALSVISASAGAAQAESGHHISVASYLDELTGQWRDQRPGIELCCKLEGRHPAPHLVAERTLTQALTSILDNAADASPKNVELKAHWDTAEVVIEVNDRGPGLSTADEEAAGKTLFTSKEQGLGLGLFLAHAAIGRLGGNVTLFNREGGGVCTRVTLPLSELSAGRSA